MNTAVKSMLVELWVEPFTSTHSYDGSVIPFTLLVILPTKKRLLSATLDRRSVEAEDLLECWGRVHAVRSVLSGLALLLFLYLVIFRDAV